uniref:Uncharacterized protein n=1 Tax=Anguilla anguilla TaxID=7936 RepID=A0A0E9PGJ6_ANGAN
MSQRNISFCQCIFLK